MRAGRIETGNIQKAHVVMLIQYGSLIVFKVHLILRLAWLGLVILETRAVQNVLRF